MLWSGLRAAGTRFRLSSRKLKYHCSAYLKKFACTTISLRVYELWEDDFSLTPGKKLPFSVSSCSLRLGFLTVCANQSRFLCNLTKYLLTWRSDDSSCLNDLPPSTRPKPPASFYTKLPGEIEDGDTQCKYQYGPEYRRCPQREVRNTDDTSLRKFVRANQ